jgi:hypothetical protein
LDFEKEPQENETEEVLDYTDDEINPNKIAEILGKETKLTTDDDTNSDQD